MTRDELEALIAQAPEAIQRLPRDPRGFPTPAFVATLPDGSRDLRVADGDFRTRCLKKRLCWVCGGTMPSGSLTAYCAGPMCVVNRVSGDPACHYGCAVFSVQACPALNGTMAQRPGKAIPDGAGVLEGHLERLPDVIAIYACRKPPEVLPSGHLRLPGAELIHWYQGGRRITEAQAKPYLEAARSQIEEDRRKAAVVHRIAANPEALNILGRRLASEDLVS